MEALNTIFTAFGVVWPKFLAQVILFLIVYWVLKKYAFGPIIAMLEQRRRLIEEGQANAEQIKAQLAEAETHYKDALHKANVEAQGIIDEARKSGEALSQKQAQEAIRQAEEIISKARVDITNEHNQMVADVKREMVGLVVDTTAKVTGKVLTPEDQQRLNEETSKQLAA
ncbi:MAG: F0F1 ATP synthase subunit B [Chthoniobacterales bacterium]